MWRRLSVLILLVSAFSAPGEIALPLKSQEEFYVYLPLAAKPSLPIEFVVTRRGESIGYPTHYYVYGYVRSTGTEPVYSVTLEVDVTIYPYSPPGEPPYPPYTSAVPIVPALEATLPGQINPFSYSLLLGKSSASIGEVRATAATLTPPSEARFVPLTIVGWQTENTMITGTVRNDQGQTLRDARVVVVEPDRCAWRETALEVTILQPGQETAFQRNMYSTYCFTENTVIVGQGAVSP
jgi:hypothetical protein